LGWKSEVITPSQHLLIVTFLEVTRRPREDMEIISAVFSGPMISEGFGKITIFGSGQSQNNRAFLRCLQDEIR
jgi:hypothetical protein